MHHNFCIHSSVDGHLGCFHVLALVKKSTMFFIRTFYFETTQAGKLLLYLITVGSFSQQFPDNYVYIKPSKLNNNLRT